MDKHSQIIGATLSSHIPLSPKMDADHTAGMRHGGIAWQGLDALKCLNVVDRDLERHKLLSNRMGKHDGPSLQEHVTHP